MILLDHFFSSVIGPTTPTLNFGKIFNPQEPSKQLSPFTHQLPKHSDVHLRFLGIYKKRQLSFYCLLFSKLASSKNKGPLKRFFLAFDRGQIYPLMPCPLEMASLRISPAGYSRQRCQSQARACRALARAKCRNTGLFGNQRFLGKRLPLSLSWIYFSSQAPLFQIMLKNWHFIFKEVLSFRVNSVVGWNFFFFVIYWK